MKAIRSVRACFSVFVVIAIALGACGGGDSPPPGEDIKSCTINTDCNNPLVCAFKRCHSQCTTSRDCPVSLRCVLSTDIDTGEVLGKVCQLPDEATKKCVIPSDCPGVQICGIDGRCRDQCAEAKDCPSRGQLCINKTCADPEELNDRGALDQVNDGGVTRDGAPIIPDDDGSTMMGAGGLGGAGGGTGGSSSTGGGMPDAGNDVSTGGTDAGRDVSQPPYDGPCGHQNEPCCATGSACTLGYVCNASKMCVTCGAKGQACCSNNNCLDPNLDCVNNTCSCGDSNQVCCAGTTCSAGLSCSLANDAGARSSCACGGNSQLCCPNMMCSSASLKCAGSRCTCITGCAADHGSGYGPNVLRSDGSVWFYTAYYQPPVPVKDVGMATVTGFTKVATAYQFSCGIKSDKTVWCWANANNTSTTPNSYGELGDGTTDWSKFPVQVVKSLTPGDYLTDAIDISTHGSTTCAVTDGGTAADGSDDYVYCWGYNGYGQRGDASTAPAKWAIRVVTAMGAGAPPLTNMDRVTLGQYHTCGHQRSSSGGEGNVWCWGYNANGQLGNDSIVQSTFAVQTVNLSDSASEVVVGNQMSCARTGPDVWCWGYGNIGDGSTGAHQRPVRVLTGADSGTPFTGVTAIRAGNGGACALLSADKSVWCWGNVAFPTQAVSAAGFPVSSVNFWDVDSSSNVCFGSTDGILYFQNQKITMNVPCP